MLVGPTALRLLDLQVDGASSDQLGDELGSVLAGLAHDVERQPEVALPALLAVAKQAAAQRAFPEALMGLLLAEQAAYEAEAWSQAREIGAKAVELARQTGDLVAEAHAYRLLALVAFDEGRSKDGHDHLLDAMASFEDANLHHEVPVLARVYGEHLAVLGAFAEAEQALRLAQERFLALGDDKSAAGIGADLKALEQRRI